MTENDKLLYRDLTEIIISAFYAVYNALGYGFLENVYASARLSNYVEGASR